MMGVKCFMKKIICYILIVCCIVSIITCHAENPTDSVAQAKKQLEELNIIDTNSFSHENWIYRCEALVPVMKIIGIPEHLAEIVSNRPHNPFYDLEDDPFLYFVLSDGSVINVVPTREQYEIKVDYYGYLLAGHEMFIVQGYKGNFRPYDAITAKEATAFMMRGIDGSFCSDIDVTYEEAKKCGLVQKKDRFYEDGDVAITENEFCVLLNRMLYQPCCKCFISKEMDSGERYETPWRDEERTKRYIDIVNGDFPESGEESL